MSVLQLAKPFLFLRAHLPNMFIAVVF